MSKMMRISDKTAKDVQELSTMLGSSKQSIIEDAVQYYLREQFLKKTNVEYRALKKDKAAWAEVCAEQEEWDAALLDGLDSHD